LLNGGDWLRFTAQVRGVFHEPSVRGRMVGVPAIRQEHLYQVDPAGRRIRIRIGAFGALGVYYYVGGLVWAAWCASADRRRRRVRVDLVAVALVNAGVSILLFNWSGWEAVWRRGHGSDACLLADDDRGHVAGPSGFVSKWAGCLASVGITQSQWTAADRGGLGKVGELGPGLISAGCREMVCSRRR
jgi:hypothetical protein